MAGSDIQFSCHHVHILVGDVIALTRFVTASGIHTKSKAALEKLYSVMWELLDLLDGTHTSLSSYGFPCRNKTILNLPRVGFRGDTGSRGTVVVFTLSENRCSQK